MRASSSTKHDGRGSSLAPQMSSPVFMPIRISLSPNKGSREQWNQEVS
jgi:hypothetical protein